MSECGACGREIAGKEFQGVPSDDPIVECYYCECGERTCRSLR